MVRMPAGIDGKGESRGGDLLPPPPGLGGVRREKRGKRGRAAEGRGSRHHYGTTTLLAPLVVLSPPKIDRRGGRGQGGGCGRWRGKLPP